MLWKSFYAGSQIRAVQIRAMRNRASRGMTVVDIIKKPFCRTALKQTGKACIIRVVEIILLLLLF